MIEVEFPDMPTPRYLHQTQGVKIQNRTNIIIMGGKTDPSDKQALNTVYRLDINDLIKKRKDRLD